MNIKHMSWQKLKSNIKSKGLILIGFGAIEDHGVLPMGTDAIIVEKILEEVSKNLNVPYLIVDISFF